MTPTEQDKELRYELSTLVHLHHYGFCDNVASRCYKAPRKYWTPACKDRAKQYEDKLVAFITADRKRVALEARIDELENRLRVQFIPSHWARLCAEVNSWAKYVDKRIAELKAQQEKLGDS